jgi:hypothetical protein
MFIAGCVGPIRHEMTKNYPAAVLRVVGTPPVIDGRTRFREIFCQLLAAEHEDPERRGRCEDYLLRLSDERVRTGISTPAAELMPRCRVIVVPDSLNGCFAGIAAPFEDAMPSLKDRGIKIDVLDVGGRSGIDTDAAYLDARIRNLDLAEDERLILVGYSKGIVDILQFLINYPAVSRRVDAVISVAGAVNGSPLAGRLDTVYAEAGRRFKTGGCNADNEEVVESLLPAVRLSWLATHPLPKAVHYFSLAAMTQRDHINALLKSGYDFLWIYSPRNDGMLLISDQLIPGGTLLGYANVDHWSVALALEDKQRSISETIRAPGRFPRGVMLRALLVYVAETLESGQE